MLLIYYVKIYLWFCRVAGWKQREHPLLHNFLHVGDLVLSVAGVPPAGAAAVKNILKNCTTPRV